MLDLGTLSEVGARLQVTLKGALESIPNAPQRPQALARALRVNKNLTSRLCAALRTQDPLATMSLVPGPAPLRQVIQAAAALGADRDQVKLARHAIEEFESIIRDEFDDRAGLDAVLGTMVPEMRRRHELAAKQAVFRGMESIKGISVDVALVTFVVHPSAETSERVDTALIGGYYGLRRIRPGASIEFSIRLSKTPFEQNPLRERLPGGNGAAGGEVNGEVPPDPLLRPFCRPTGLTLNRTDYDGELASYEVAGTAIGRSAAIDVVLGEYYPRYLRSDPPSPGRVRHFDSTIEQPCKVLVFDVLLHESLWPGTGFDLTIYDTTIKGMVDPNDPLRRKSRLSLAESVQPVEGGLAGLRSTHVPQYPELLAHVLGRLGWIDGRFRAHRCTIAYPLYGSQVCLVARPGIER